MTNLVVVPTYFAIEPKRISSTQTRPGGIEGALQDVRRRHIRHPASLGRQLIGCLGARPETREDCDGSEYTEQYAQHAVIHGLHGTGGSWEMMTKLMIQHCFAHLSGLQTVFEDAVAYHRPEF